MPNIILTPPRVPLVDPRTGLVDRAWYLFFRSLNNAANDFINNPQVGPDSGSLIAGLDAALQALAQNVETQPLPVDLSAELTKQIEAAGLADYATGLLSQIAEMQKQLEAFNLLPPPSQGTVVAVTATAPVASSGGIAPDISLNAAYGDTLNPYAAKTANFVLAGPTSGAAAVPTFRALTATDIPTLAYVTSVSGTAGRITSTGGTTPVIDLASGVATPGTTGSSTQVPVITIDTYGRVTSITTAANPQGTVTSVTGTAPVVSSGGATPAISMPAATTSVNGYLTSTDWNTFNGKGSGSVTSVAASVPSFLSIAGSPITTSGTLAISLSGTALPTTSGGTGLTSFTANGVVYASSTSALATGSTFVFNGTNVGIGTSSPVGRLSIDLNTASTVTNTLTLNNNAGGAGNGTAVNFYNSGASQPFTGRINSLDDGAFGFHLVFSTKVPGSGGAGALTEHMRIASNGIVTMSAYGAGTATFSAAGVISSVSDETWKTKDGAPVNPDAMIKKLQPGYWYYNEEKRKTFGEERQLGFYAQNVNAAIGPEAAPEPEEGKPWGYYDRSVLAVVVMSLQNALDTIDSLTARIAALEQK